MIVTMIPYCPSSEGKDLGFAYNELMARLHDGDWACFLDHDACFTTYDWYAQLEEITAGLSGPCVLTALTNRVGSRWQLATGVDRDEHSMVYHRRVGEGLRAAARCAVRDVTDASPMSGVVILLSKETWRHLGGFEPGFLGVDTALHRAARDRGGRVYLMEGVYVYHWYRADRAWPVSSPPADDPTRIARRVDADPAGRPVEVTSPLGRFPASGDPCGAVPILGLGDPEPGLADGIGVQGRRVLVIDRDVVRPAAELVGQGPARLVAVELEASSLGRARERLGEVAMAGEDLEGQEFEACSFDVIFCGGLLENSRRPAVLLARLRRWLAPDGRLVATVANVRRLGVVWGLLEGRWDGAAGMGRRPLRYFTRREVEKLYYRAGFGPPALRPLPTAGHDEWIRRGRPGEVRVGNLHIGGFDPEEAEEFHIDRYRIEARPAEPTGHGLTSIVILTHDQLDYTRQCLDSIRRFTDEPYELIVVDNASFDGTLEYLRSQPDVRLVANGENRGFPTAANQGIAVSVLPERMIWAA